MSFFRKLFNRTSGKEEQEVAPPAAEATIATPDPVAEGPAPAAEPQSEAERRSGWFSRLSEGLSKASRSITGSITSIFTKKKLDKATLQDLEDVLLQADLGLPMAERIVKEVSSGRYDKEIDPEEVKRILADEVAKVLKPVEVPFTFGAQKPFIILVVGVNGAGKTTTIGKLGSIARAEGHKVMFAACDTFRAAAIEQLNVWGGRIGAKVMSRPTGADASGLAFDAIAEAKADGTDILFIDTAGRLQNKQYLMDELDKIVRVIKKQDEGAPHAVLLVLDATTGQNALSQIEVFSQVAGVTGRKDEGNEPKPPVSVKKSITPDYLICLEDGKKFKSLKRHLRTRYDMSPEEYREKWGLAADYPMVAPAYAKQRSDLARKMGLGLMKK